MSVLAFASCIRDEIEPCPPLQVRIAVKDKNYFNINEVVRLGYAEKLAEDLPFRDYVKRHQRIAPLFSDEFWVTR